MTAPTQLEMMLPLLEVVADLGTATPAQCYDRIAAKLAVAPEERTRRVPNGESTVNAFERTVRWVQQRAKALGLLERDDGGWKVTAAGKAKLTSSRPGVLTLAFTTEHGVAVWGDAFDASRLLDPGTVQLLFTSPPYPLLKQKSYGGAWTATEYVDWITRLVEAWLPTLAADGSLVLNLGDAWLPGMPAQSTYQERVLIALEDRLGLRLCQRFAWHSPTKLPAPAQYVNIERCRVKTSLEQVYWLSPSARPYANNRDVLVPYSDAMKARLAQGGEKGARRPSGFVHAAGAFGADNGGAIPSNLIVASNSESNSPYIRACKAQGLPVHPARFPIALPEFFIKLLTRVHDLVADPFGGSGTTGRAAENLDRRWLIIEQMREYLAGAYQRFPASAMAA